MKKYLLKRIISIPFLIIFVGLVCCVLFSLMLDGVKALDYDLDMSMKILCISTILFILLLIVYTIYKISDIIVECIFYYKENKKDVFLGDITLWKK